MTETLKIYETFFLIALISSLKETLNKITNIDSNFSNQAGAAITKTLLFGNSNYFNEVKLQILNASINFALTSKGFDKSLLNS